MNKLKLKIIFNTFKADAFAFFWLFVILVISIVSIYYSYFTSLVISVLFIFLTTFSTWAFIDIFSNEYKIQYKKYKKLKRQEHENIIISKINKMLSNLPNDRIYLFYVSEYVYNIAEYLNKSTLNYYGCDFIIDETKVDLEIGLHKNNELINNTEKFFDYDN